MNATYRAVLALCLLGWILGVGFTSLFLFRRRPRDLSNAGGSALLGPSIRGWHFENLGPLEEVFVRWGVSPASLSYLQFVLAVCVGLCYATGLIFVGGWLVLSAGSLDILDGRVARRTNRGSAQGAFLDSVIDRYADAFAHLGLVAFFMHSWVVWFVLFALVGGFMVSYTRARAEGLGASCQVGLLQRPERYVLLGFGSLFGSIVEHAVGWRLWGAPYGLVVLTVIVLALLSNVTALHRAVYVMRFLGRSNEAGGAS